MMAKRRRRHNEEFKREAVKLVTEQGYTVAEAARSLGLDASLVRSWKLRYAREQQNGAAKMQESEQEEVGRLREENRRLRMERDILKKATAFFANEKS
jgi:transposase